MRHILLSSCAVLLVAVFLVGCNSSDPKPVATTQTPRTPATQVDTTYPDGVRRITIAEANQLTRKGQAFFVDVRNQASFDAGHIPGAKLIPQGEILAHINELPRDKTIITYCS